MNLKTRDSFIIRLYQWAISNFKKEIDDGFPILKKFKSVAAHGLVQYFENLSLNDKHKIAKILVKKWMRGTYEIINESISDEEEKILQTSIDKMLVYEQHYRDQYYINRYLKKMDRGINRSKLVLLAKSKLKLVCGEMDTYYSKYEWIQAVRLGPWKIETIFDASGTIFQLDYRHRIVDIHNENNCLIDFISVLRWFGIDYTPLDIIKESEEEEAVEGLVVACSHFIKAAEGLLKDLCP